MESSIKIDRLTVKSLDVVSGDGPSIHVEAMPHMAGMWFQNHADYGQDSPSLGIIMEKGQPPYLAFRTSNREHLPAAITIDPESGRLIFQAPSK